VIKYSGRGNDDTNLPMLISLHGDGDTPGNFYDTALDLFKTPARIILLKAPKSYSGGRAWPWDAAGVQEASSASHGVTITLLR
jgi:predicted esterase